MLFAQLIASGSFSTDVLNNQVRPHQYLTVWGGHFLTRMRSENQALADATSPGRLGKR